MNIYFCREWDETAGFYVVAPTRGRAKAAFAWETNSDYVDVRATLAVRDVDAELEKCLFDYDKDDLALMERCGLQYDYSEV